MMDGYQNVKVIIFTSQSNPELLIRHTLRAISRAKNDLKKKYDQLCDKVEKLYVETVTKLDRRLLIPLV